MILIFEKIIIEILNLFFPENHPLRLKKIKIHGFKSFADKVSLDFHEGITGIVGPNGCGKSNILDAFRWVLGETSARSLRGKKMEDVIFAGTDTRKPLNFAEVTLSFKDADQLLKTEYNEIEIARRCHRNGETEYFINKQQVRMKDVVNLFLDTGIGKSAFSIFEQGKIDQVIQYTPNERRAIFEEAAGILRFLERKKEALRKLEGLDQNLLRANDIHREIEKQIDHLGKQVAIAVSYQEKKKKLQQSEIDLLLFKRKRSKDKLEKLLSEENKLKRTYEEGELIKAKLDEALFSEKELLETLLKQFQKSNEKVYQVRSEKEIRCREQKSNEERLKETKSKISIWKQKLETMQLEQLELKAQEGQLKKKITLSQAHVDEKTVLLNKERNRFKESEQKLEVLREKLHISTHENLKELEREKSIESDLRSLQVKEEGLSERLKEIDNREKELQNNLLSYEEKKCAYQKSVKNLVEEIDIKKEFFLDLEEKHKEITEELLKIDDEERKCDKMLFEIEARISSLLKLKAELVGFSSASKKLMEESKNPKSPFYNKIFPLFERFKLKKEKLQSLHHFLKPYQSVLVVEKSHLQHVLKWIEKEKLTEFSFLVLDEESKMTMPSQKIAAANRALNEGEGDYFEKLFLQNVFAFDSLEEGLRFIENNPGSEALINNEIGIDQKKVVFIGKATEGNPILREAEIKELEDKQAQVSLKKKELASTLKKLEEKKHETHEKRLELDKIIRKAEMRLVEENFFLQNTLSDLTNNEKELKLLLEESALSQAALKQHHERILLLKKDHEAASLKRMELEKRAQECHEELLENEQKAKLIRQEVVEMTALLDESVDYLKKALHEVELIKAKENASEKEKKILLDEMSASEEWLERFSHKSEDFEQSLKSVEESLMLALDECHKLGEVCEEKKRDIKEKEENLKQTLEKSKSIEQEASKIAIQKAEVETDVRSCENELSTRFQMEKDQIAEAPISLSGSLDSIERSLKELRKELEVESQGVNMSSIEEFEKQKERGQFFGSQIEDLTVSKNELLAIISELDSKSRAIFKETFDKIRENFRKNFQILFVGGEADLELIESEDILQAGIEIIAKPPGKKMRSINLLSGGEKCLTAMALLFSLFEVKPSPFCILDEIDAPLDDTNVERFLNVVLQFTDRSQFIIITHNKRTMAICNRIFGVSMEEKGVSKLLSIEFSKERMTGHLVGT